MAEQNKNKFSIMGMSVKDILTGNNYDLETARNRVPFVNNWTSGLFATLKNLYANQVPNEAYALYKQQEREIVATAETNAAMVRAKGEVELRNLQYQHDIAMGSDIIKVSGSGGNLSGSFLDALMQQRKYQMMDEKTVATNTINQASAIMKEGYRNAANVALQAQTMSQKQKYGVVGSILAGVDKYFEMSFKDKTEAARQAANNEVLERYKENFEDYMKKQYGLTDSDFVLDEVQATQKKVLEEHGAKKIDYGVLGGFEQNLGEDTNPFGSQDIFA